MSRKRLRWEYESYQLVMSREHWLTRWRVRRGVYTIADDLTLNAAKRIARALNAVERQK